MSRRVEARHERGRRLFEHLLVPALHRALAVEQMQHGAMAVPDHLDLDVARRGEVALQEHVVRAERGGGLPPCRGDGLGELAPLAHQAHPPAPSPGRGLDQERVADARTCGLQCIGRCPGVHHGARQHRDAGGGHDLLRPRLVAHDPHRLGRRPHPHDAGLGARLRAARGSRTGTRSPGAAHRPPRPAPHRRVRPGSGTCRPASPRATARRCRPLRHTGWRRRRGRRRRPRHSRHRARP